MKSLKIAWGVASNEILPCASVAQFGYQYFEVSLASTKIGDDWHQILSTFEEAGCIPWEKIKIIATSLFNFVCTLYGGSDRGFFFQEIIVVM